MPASPIRKLVPLAEAARSRGIRIYHPQHRPARSAVAPDGTRSVEEDRPAKYSNTAPATVTGRVREKLAGYYQQYQIKNFRPKRSSSPREVPRAVLFAFMSCLNPGDEIIVPEPAYANYMAFAILGGRRDPSGTSRRSNRVLRCPTSRSSKKLINERTRGIRICNPNNPTGYLYNPQGDGAHPRSG